MQVSECLRTENLPAKSSETEKGIVMAMEPTSAPQQDNYC